MVAAAKPRTTRGRAKTKADDQETEVTESDVTETDEDNDVDSIPQKAGSEAKAEMAKAAAAAKSEVLGEPSESGDEPDDAVSSVLPVRSEDEPFDVASFSGDSVIVRNLLSRNRPLQLHNIVLQKNGTSGDSHRLVGRPRILNFLKLPIVHNYLRLKWISISPVEEKESAE